MNSQASRIRTKVNNNNDLPEDPSSFFGKLHRQAIDGGNLPKRKRPPNGGLVFLLVVP
jgi:hypothetical protein